MSHTQTMPDPMIDAPLPPEPEPAEEAIDFSTIDPRHRWIEERRAFIGGSEAYQLLNQAQYGKGCARQLAYDKLNVEPDFPVEIDEDLMRRGQLLEPIVAAQYKEETGRDVVRAAEDIIIGHDGTKHRLPRARRSKEFPWAGVHVDRTIRAGSAGVQETGDLEIKSRAEGPFLRVMRAGPFPGDILQVQWANFVTTHTWGALAMVGVFGALPMKHVDVKRHESVIEVFKREGEAFASVVWGKGQLPDAPLPADDARCKICPWRMDCRGQATDAAMAKAMKAEKDAKGELVTISNVPQLPELLMRRELADREVKSTKVDIEQLDEQIMELQRPFGDKAYVVGFGKSYINKSRFNGLDQTRLKNEKPEVYSEYFVSRVTDGGDWLRLYPEKGIVA